MNRAGDADSAAHATDYRYERKFVLHDVYFSELVHHVRSHPAIFEQHYPDRRINNIYLDTHALDNFQDSINGMSARYKARIRWYGRKIEYADDPVYELKIKNGLVGCKYKYRLASFGLPANGLKERILGSVAGTELPHNHLEVLKSSAPALINSYSRKYFLSRDGRFRLTLDTDHWFHDVYSMVDSRHSVPGAPGPQDVIMEIKYNAENDDGAERITNHLPYRLSKSSKYVDGVCYFYL